MPHPLEHAPATRPLDGDEAAELAETLRALGSPGRLRLLMRLLEGPQAVERLAAVAELSPTATSHHLRLLRSLRLVRARRDGRHVLYELHDHHVAELLRAVRHHHEHLHPPAPVALPAAEAAAR